MKPGEKIADGSGKHGSKKRGAIARGLTKVIFAKPIAFAKRFHPPKPITSSQALDPEDEKYVKSVVTTHSDFVLSNLEEREVLMLIEAMEKFSAPLGEKIIKQGDVGDYLYILKEGSIRYLKDGDEIGIAGPGEVFGEIALLYDCPRAATVVADTECILYRVSREIFRRIQASFILSNDDEARRLLKKTKLFEGFPDDIVHEMASCILKKQFQKEDILVHKGDSVEEVYFMKEGRVLGRDIKLRGVDFADIEFKPGDSFGERAIVMNEPAMGTAECLTNGVAYVLTKERFLHCMKGMNLHEILQHTSDVNVLRASPFFANSDVSETELRQAATKFTNITLEPGEALSTIGKEMEPSLYYTTSENKDPRLELSRKNSEPEVLVPLFPFGFGKHAMTMYYLHQANPALADSYRKKFKLTDLDTKEQIQTQFDNIIRRNCVISQFWIKNEGKETIHLRKLVLKDILDIIYDPSVFGKNFQRATFDNSISYETLEKKCLLGQGSFGEVWLCKDAARDAPYALKIQYKRELIQQHQAAGVVRESQVMQKLHHPFVMGLVQAQQSDQCLYMIMDPVQGGELSRQMRNDNRKVLPEQAAKFYAACIFEGLSYMHRRNFIYRDLKGENVLLDKDGYCVIVDLGFAKHVPDKTFTFCGTPTYIAPEILLNKGHDKSADIWSFGVMIYEMLFGTNPFFDYDDPTIDQRKLFKRIVKAEFQRPRNAYSLDAYSNTTVEGKDLIKKLLVVNTSKRIGCTGNGDLSIRNHPWFNDIDFRKLYHKEIDAPWVPEISDPFDSKNFKEVIPKPKSGLMELDESEQKKFEGFC